MADVISSRKIASRPLLIILATIIFTEIVIMGAVRLLFENENIWLDVIIDAGLLAIFTFPSLYLLMLRPLEREVAERIKSETELRHAKELLEITNQKLELMLAREQQLARVDGMTGLFNYRHFFESASHEFFMARRYQHPLVILMCDTDNFKTINDTLGHSAGDRMLCLVAQAAGEHLRAVDMLARYGGDEFIILLPQTSVQQAFHVAERILADVAQTVMETEKGTCSVTFSIGMADVRHEPLEDSVESIIQRADQALYKAKEAGGNCTVIFNPE